MKEGEEIISLFADDALLYLFDLKHWLVQLFSLLKQYGSFSGYKLNVQKIQVLTFKEIPWKDLRTKFQLQWNTEYISAVQKTHYAKLFSCWRQCRSSKAHHYHLFWACLVLSFFGRRFMKAYKKYFRWTLLLNWRPCICHKKCYLLYQMPFV